MRSSDLAPLGVAAPMKRPLLTYLALTFGISWGGVLLVVGPGGFPGTVEAFGPLLPWVVTAMLAGPSIAGLLSTWLVHGRTGLREFGSRLLMWRVGARWYAVALLTAPLIVAGTLFALSLISPAYRPGIVTTTDPVSHLLIGLATGFAAGLFEELGWTGFALPMLRRRFSVRATGIVLGLIWGAWHFLASWWGSTGSVGSVPITAYMVVILFSFLPPYRMLMVWVHERTGSLLVAMLMHASLTASVRIFDPLAISGAPIITYNIVHALVLWGVVAAVVGAAGRGRSAGRSHMRAMAGLVVLGAVLATSACFGYQKVESAPRPGSRVRVVLASATDITTLAADSTRRAYAAVLEASGTIQAAAGDTMALRLGEVRTATGAIPGVAGQVALLPTDRIARIEERQFQAGRTALAGVGTATLALAVFLVVVISALTQGF